METSRSLLPLRPRPQRRSKGRACTETAAKEKELLLPQLCRLPLQPPLPQLPRPTQPGHYPDHGTAPHGTHAGLVRWETPRCDGGSQRANPGGVGVTPGSRPASLSLGGCSGRRLPRRGCAMPQARFDGLPPPPANKFCHYF